MIDTRPTILYIAGFGRSGSTILGMVLGAHPEALAVGEINQVFINWMQPKKRCACGERLHRCPLWTQVRAHFEQALPDITLERAAAITHAIEHLGARPSPDQRAQYRAIWQALLTSVAQVSGARYIVDSSKTAADALHRPAALREAGFEVRVVHLVRDPRAVVWSTIRLHRERTQRTNWIDTTARGVKTLAHLVLTETRQSSLVRLSYEDLTTQPQRTLEQIGAGVGIDFAPVIAQIARGDGLIAEHVLAGDLARMDSARGGLHLRPARADWRGQLPPLLVGLAAIYGRVALKGDTFKEQA